MNETHRKCVGHISKVSQKNGISKKTPKKFKMADLGTQKPKNGLKTDKNGYVRSDIFFLFFFSEFCFRDPSKSN